MRAAFVPRLISFVGLQPGAIAVAVKTWQAVHKLPVDLLLLATLEVQTAAQRIRQWASSMPKTSCTIIDLDDGMAERDGAIEELIGNVVKGHAASDLCFLADAGIRPTVVTAVRQLSPETIVAQCDSQYLYQRPARLIGTREYLKSPLADLGLDALLDLYGFHPITKPNPSAPALTTLMARYRITPPPRVRRDVSFFSNSRIADMAYEARGQLHLLFQENECENVHRIARIDLDLPDLRPRIAVLTSDAKVRERVWLAGHQVIDISQKDKLASWVQGHTPPPGGAPLSLAERHAWQRQTARGAGGDGPELAVCLGPDPSTTLLAIYAHRPAKAHVFFDAHNQSVKQKALWLKTETEKKQIPITELRLIPTDHLGSDIHDELLKPEVGGDCGANIMPGTKLQACVLGGIPGMTAWTLDPISRQPQRIGGDRAMLNGKMPPITTWASVCGGPIERNTQNPNDFDASRRSFLLDYLSFMANALSDPAFDRSAPDTVKERTAACGAIRIAAEHEDHEDEADVIVQRDGSEVRGKLPKDRGQWLEQAAAVAFLKAGAAEALLNLKWPWLREATSRAELDVVFRYGAAFFAAECKTGDWGRADVVKIEAQARNLGRSCVPVLVCPRPRALVEKSVRSHRGVLFLGWNDLLDTARLQTILECAVRSRSAIRDS